MKIQTIAQEFEGLLNLKDKNIDYELYISAEQGVGFFPLNKNTAEAMKKIPFQSYETLLDNLMIISKDTESGQGYNLRRKSIFTDV